MQGGRTGRGPRPINEEIRAFLRRSGLGSTPRHTRVFDAWSEAMGIPGNQRAQPVRFRAGELTVEVSSAVHLHELQGFTGDDIRRKANANLGTDEIRRVVFRLRS